jgi:hypothetical protein
MSPDQSRAPQEQTKTRSRPVEYSVVSRCPPSASDNAVAHAGQYRDKARSMNSMAGDPPASNLFFARQVDPVVLGAG